eukprot:6210005-Pleurochrysis_carterae.AAC.1
MFISAPLGTSFKSASPKEGQRVSHVCNLQRQDHSTWPQPRAVGLYWHPSSIWHASGRERKFGFTSPSWHAGFNFPKWCHQNSVKVIHMTRSAIVVA